jgi:hypothetical protein
MGEFENVVHRKCHQSGDDRVADKHAEGEDGQGIVDEVAPAESTVDGDSGDDEKDADCGQRSDGALRVFISAF